MAKLLSINIVILIHIPAFSPHDLGAWRIDDASYVYSVDMEIVCYCQPCYQLYTTYHSYCKTPRVEVKAPQYSHAKHITVGFQFWIVLWKTITDTVVMILKMFFWNLKKATLLNSWGFGILNPRFLRITSIKLKYFWKIRLTNWSGSSGFTENVALC